MNILEKQSIDANSIISIVNSLADLIQFNNQCEYIELFNNLADLIVNVIEQFNSKADYQYINIENIVDNLKVTLNKLKTDIINRIKINIYFYGDDKYNILQKALIKEFKVISDFNEYSNIDKKLQEHQLNILILSEETRSFNLEDNVYFDDIIYYDTVMNYMFNISEKIYYSNYDYNYLLKSLEKAVHKDIDTIVVGNSYPLTGIDVNLLDSKCVSLALSSQDLYYSYKLAQLAINNNENIKRCIIGAGYYLVNHDLSRSKSEDARSRVKNVYYPILMDKHNSEQVDNIEILNLRSILSDSTIDYIFDLTFLDAYFKDLIFRDNNGYFNLNFDRKINNMLGKVKLSDLKEEEKYQLGRCRADQHNKLSKYTNTTDEYNHVFNEFMKFLNNKNIEPILVVFPSTKYYNKFLNKNYEESFYTIVSEISEKFEIKIIDFSKNDIFEESDFIDFDHMSEVGAIKITKKLKKSIYSCIESSR